MVDWIFLHVVNMQRLKSQNAMFKGLFEIRGFLFLDIIYIWNIGTNVFPFFSLQPFQLCCIIITNDLCTVTDNVSSNMRYEFISCDILLFH